MAAKTTRKRSPRQAIVEAPAPAEPKAVKKSGCSVTVADQHDALRESAYGGAFIATCKRCGLASAIRSTEERARRELAQLCARANA